MHVLSVEDIDLMIMLVDNAKLPSEVVRHEKQMDKLISMGIIRPGGGVLALTDLGYKTANGLLGRCLGSVVDGPVRPGAASAQSTAPAQASPPQSAMSAGPDADDGPHVDGDVSAPPEAAAEAEPTAETA